MLLLKLDLLFALCFLMLPDGILMLLILLLHFYIRSDHP